MKTLTKSLVAVGIVAGVAGLALIPPTLAHGEKKFSRGYPGSFGHAGKGRHAMRLFERFDANGDGTVTQQEIEQTRTGLIAKFDADSDGKLSLKEYEGLWMEFMRERMVDRFQHLDRDGDAIVTPEEFASPMTYIVRRIDRDDDGKITRQEVEQMRGHGHHGGYKWRHRKDDDD